MRMDIIFLFFGTRPSPMETFRLPSFTEFTVGVGGPSSKRLDMSDSATNEFNSSMDRRMADGRAGRHRSAHRQTLETFVNVSNSNSSSNNNSNSNSNNITEKNELCFNST